MKAHTPASLSLTLTQPSWSGQINFPFLNWMEERRHLTSGGGEHTKWPFPSVLGCPFAGCFCSGPAFGGQPWTDFLPPSHGGLESKQEVYMPAPYHQESYSLGLCFPPRLKSGVRASLLGSSQVSYRVYNSPMGYRE